MCPQTWWVGKYVITGSDLVGWTLLYRGSYLRLFETSADAAKALTEHATANPEMTLTRSLVLGWVRTFPVNMSTRKVGGLRFIKLGRLTVSYSVAKEYRPIGRAA